MYTKQDLKQMKKKDLVKLVLEFQGNQNYIDFGKGNDTTVYTIISDSGVSYPVGWKPSFDERPKLFFNGVEITAKR